MLLESKKKSNVWNVSMIKYRNEKDRKKEFSCFIAFIFRLQSPYKMKDYLC